MTWEKTADYIRSGHGDKSKYDPDSFRTITIDEKEGIKAIIGCPKGHFRDMGNVMLGQRLNLIYSP